MNNNDIQKARNEYNRRLKEKEELIKLKEELTELENNPNVKRYLEINNVKNKYVPSEIEIIRTIFFGLNEDDNDNDFKIYLYMGAYNRASNYGKHDNFVFDSTKADYLLYNNICDISDLIEIKPSMQEQFEKENVVLKTENILKVQSKYYELQNIYYEQLLKSDLIDKVKILEKIKENL